MADNKKIAAKFAENSDDYVVKAERQIREDYKSIVSHYGADRAGKILKMAMESIDNEATREILKKLNS